jgi:hypothetical protein
MQIDDLIRNCVVFIGNEVGDQFHAEGTGFLAALTSEEYDFRHVITAAHVVWPERRRPGNRDTSPQGTIALRMNKKGGLSRTFTTNRSDWIFPTSRSLDLCAYRFSEYANNPENDLVFTWLNLSTIALINKDDHFEEYGIYRVFDRQLCLGDEVFLTGVFVSHIGSKRNIPIIRIGNVAAMPEEPIEFFSPTRPAYLIETRSLGGLSGSPVFLHLYPERMRGDRVTMAWARPGTELRDGDEIIVPYILIGMVLGTPGSSQYLKDFPDSEMPIVDADFNSGISVVLPVKQIIEFLHMPELLQERAEAIAARRKLSGYRK